MRRILWRHRCAELYRAFLNDPSQSGLVVEDSQHLRHERLEERIVLNAPTIDQSPDVEAPPGSNDFSVELTGITDGDGGSAVATVTAVRVNISGESDILSDINVSYTAGDSTATLTFDTSNNRGADDIRVTVTDDADETVTMTFRVTVPLAVDDTATTTENAAISGNLLSNDNLFESEFAITNIKINGGADQDPTGAIVSPGTLTLDAENGSFSFDPGSDFDYLADGESTTLIVEYEVTEWDNARRSGSDVTDVESATLTITITGQNDAPNIDLDADDSSGAAGNDYQGTYFIGQASPSAVVDSDLDITDPDQNQEFASATITLTNPSDGIDEGISIASVPVGVTVDTSVANQITFTSSTPGGTITAAQLETILKTLTYENTSLTPTAGQRTITLVVNDGTVDSATATSTITVALNSDLAISATSTPASVHAGQQITYTITATNNGPGDSTQVKVSDLIPTGTSYVSATPSSGTFENTTGEWTIGDLDSGESVTLSLVVLVPSTTASGASITNQGTITSDAAVFNDPTAGNNTLAETTSITREVDIEIAAFTGPSSATAGQQATYSITVTNNGPSEATGVAIDVPTPLGTSVVTASTSASYNAAQQSFLIGTLDAGASVTLTYVIALDSDLASGTTFDVVPTVDLVALAETDSDGTNDQESITTTVTTLVDLDVAIVESADPVDAGSSMTYTVTVGNKSDFSDATGVEIELTVPPEVTDASAFVPSVGSVAFDSMSGKWIWTVGDLASGASETVVMTVDVPVSAADNAQLSIDAAVSAVDQSENDITDDVDSETTDIDAVIDIAIVSVDGPTTVIAGQTATYTIVVRNDGGLTETDVRIQINQPTGTVNGSDTGSTTKGSFIDANNYFDIGSLAPGEEVTLTYTVTISSNLNDGDTVTVSPFLRTQNLDGTDVDSTNDQIPTAPSFTTTINTIVDLDVAIVESTDPVLAGNSMTYTVTASNKNGYSDATGVVIELDVPPEVTDASAFNPSTGSVAFDAVSGNWLWTIGDLDANDSETVTITVNVPSSAADDAQLQMTAAVSTVGQTENDNSDDTDTETTDIDRDANLSLTVSDTPDPVTAGQNISYTLTVDNLGPSDASNVQVVIPVPAGATVNSGSFSPSVGTVAFDSVSGNWIWTIGTLTESAAAPTLTFHVTVDQTIADGGTITLSPTVSGTETDSTPGNDTPSETTTVANATPTHIDPMFLIDEDTGPTTTTIKLLDHVDDDQGDTNLSFSNVVIGGVSIDLTQPAGTTYSIPSGALGNATVTIIDSTTISYTVPTLVDGLPSNENYDVSLTFDVTDSAGQSHAATISLTIDGQNDPPTANPDPATTPADTTIDIAVLTNDTDVDVIGASNPSEQLGIDSFGSNYDATNNVFLSSQSVSGATLTLVPGSGGTLDSLIYDPTGVQAFQDLAPGESLVDTFEYILVDSNGLTSRTTVTVTVTGVNDIPVGVPTTFTTDEDNSLSIDWRAPFDPRDNNDSIDVLVSVDSQALASDTTPIEVYDGATLIGTLVYDATSETLTFVPDDSLQSLSIGQSVQGTFTMVVEDSFGGQSLPVTFTIVVNGANDNPELGVNPIVGTTDEDTTTTVPVVDFFDDIDTDSAGNLSIAEVAGQPVDTTSNYSVTTSTGQVIGTVSYNSGDNSLTFTPDLSLQQLPEGSSIQGTVSLQVTDQHGGLSGTADLTVTVTGLNDSPIFTLSNVQFDGAPTQSTGVTATIVEGTQILLSGSFTDVDQPVGTVDEGSHTLRVMYEIKGIPYEVEIEDFTVTQQVIGGQTVNVFTFSTTLTFPDDPASVPDELTITLELSDNDAPDTDPVVLTETFTVEVLNQNPEITSLPKTTTLNSLGQVSLPLGVSDPGVLDSLSVYVDWGDGRGLVLVESGIVLNEDGTADLLIENQYSPNDVDELNFDIFVEIRDEDGGVSSQFTVNVTVPAGLGFLNVTPEEEPEEPNVSDPEKPVPIGRTTILITVPDDVQRALSQPGEVETIELELRIVWNHGEADEWEEKIRQRIAENRTELQEKLKELSELLQGLPDNQYRAYLTRGDGSEILLQEVRIREGKIVDTNQKPETPSAQNTTGAAANPAPDQEVPGEPTTRLELVIPMGDIERPEAVEHTPVDPFARFGREARIEAWQSVYRARVASFKDN